MNKKLSKIFPSLSGSKNSEIDSRSPSNSSMKRPVLTPDFIKYDQNRLPSITNNDSDKSKKQEENKTPIEKKVVKKERKCSILLILLIILIILLLLLLIILLVIFSVG